MHVRHIVVGLGVAVLLAGCTHTLSSPGSDSQTYLPESYTVPVLSEESSTYLLELAYQTAIGRDYQIELHDSIVNELHNPVMLVAREDGQFRASSWAREGDLVVNVRRAAQEIAEDDVLTDPDDVYMHLFVLGSEQPYDEDFELGVDSVHLSTPYAEALVWPTYPIERNYISDEKLFTRICQEITLPKDCYLDEQVELTYAPALHIGQSRDRTETITYYRGKNLEEFEQLATGLIRSLADPAEDWLIDAVDESGKFIYLYNPSNGTYSEGNNMIRQLMGSRYLAELAQTNDQAARLHRQNLDYIFNNWYQLRDGRGYIYYDEKSKLGAMAMALRTLVASPYFEDYAPQAEQLAATILSLQDTNGSFRPWYIEPDYEYDSDYLMKFYSGEAILALIELYERTGEERYLRAATRAQDYYLFVYVRQIERNYYPAYVPWHTISLNKLYQITQDEVYAQAAFVLNDKLISEMLDSDTEPKDTLGRFYNDAYPHYGTPHSSSDGVYMEGLVYAYELAELLEDDERMDMYGDAIELAVHNLRVLQYSEHDMYFMHYPGRVEGAIRYSVTDNRIRIDTTQHMLDGLTKLETVF